MCIFIVARHEPTVEAPTPSLSISACIRAFSKLREAAGVKGSQRVGENVFRVGGGQPERSERPAADVLERREKGPPRLRIPALTASHQVEQVRADRVLRRESSIHGCLNNKASLPPLDAALVVPHFASRSMRRTSR